MTTVYQKKLVKWVIFGLLSWIGIIFFWQFIFAADPIRDIIMIISEVVISIIWLIKRPRKIGQDYDSVDNTTEPPVKKEIDISSPIQILKERLAKGEISLEEFEEVKKELV